MKEWLKEQEEKIPNSELIKHFKWFLMVLEKDVKKNIYNQKHVDLVDKYATKVIDRRLMKEEDIVNFIGQIIKELSDTI